MSMATLYGIPDMGGEVRFPLADAVPTDAEIAQTISSEEEPEGERSVFHLEAGGQPEEEPQDQEEGEEEEAEEE